MYRKILNSGESTALYDSHSGVALIPFKEKYAYKDKRDRAPLRDDFVLIHETTHWMQHVGTGFGGILNQIRKWRDHLTINALQENPSLLGSIISRIEGENNSPIFGLLSLEETREGLKTCDTWALSCAFYWTEQLLTDEKLASHRNEYIPLMGICFAFIEYGFDVIYGSVPNFSENYIRNSRFSVLSVDDNPRIFSTWQIAESNAHICEAFMDIWVGNSDEIGRRHKNLFHTHYYDPLAFAFGMFQENNLVKDYQKNPRQLLTIFLATQIAIDVAFDVYAYPYGSFEGLLDQDIYVPTRFHRALEAISRIGFLEAEKGVSVQEIGAFRKKVAEEAKLKCSVLADIEANLPTVKHNEYYKSLFYVNEPLIKILNEPPRVPHSLYNMIQFYQNETYKLRKNSDVFYTTDFLATIMSGDEVIRLDFSTFADGGSKQLFLPPILVYEYGNLGFQEKFQAFSFLFFLASLGTYPIFGLVAEPNKLMVGPTKYELNMDFMQQFKSHLFAVMHTTPGFGSSP